MDSGNHRFEETFWTPEQTRTIACKKGVKLFSVFVLLIDQGDHSSGPRFERSLFKMTYMG